MRGVAHFNQTYEEADKSGKVKGGEDACHGLYLTVGWDSDFEE